MLEHESMDDRFARRARSRCPALWCAVLLLSGYAGVAAAQETIEPQQDTAEEAMPEADHWQPFRLLAGTWIRNLAC